MITESFATETTYYFTHRISEAEFFEEFRKAGAVVFDNADDVAKFRDALFENGKVRPGLVGKDTNVIAEAAGYNLPEGTKVIGLEDRRRW